MKKAATNAAVLACALAFLVPTPQFRFRLPQHCLLPVVSIAPTADPFVKCDIQCQMTGPVVPAAGRFDGFWNRNLKAWDLAAGALIVQKADSMVSSFVGELFSCHSAEPLASSGRIQQAMLDAMRG